MRVTIQLEIQERDALVTLAQIERRDPRDQAALIIRDELVRRGLLTTDSTSTQPARIHITEFEHERAS
jgi:hypothetical protein